VFLGCVWTELQRSTISLPDRENGEQLLCNFVLLAVVIVSQKAVGFATHDQGGSMEPPRF